MIQDNIISNTQNIIQNPEKMYVLVHDIEESINKNSKMLNNFTVHDGWLGISLFYCYYAKFTNNDIYYDKAEMYLDKALALTNYKYYKKIYPTDSYDYNLAGLGKFFVLTKKNNFLDIEICSYLENIDDMLTTLCKNKLDYGDLSLLSGAIAAGHYFIYNDCDDCKSKKVLSDIVDGIEKFAKRDDNDNFYWENIKLKNKTYFGVTHGSAMIISFLTSVFEKGVSKDKCAYIISKAIPFVLKHKSGNSKGLFPNILGKSYEFTQFSQCYGDLGVAYGLFRGSKTLKHIEYINESNLILKICMEREYDQTATFDASLIYGASGIAYIFEKMSRLNPENINFQKSYHYWMNQVPNYIINDNDFCGFESTISQYSPHFNLSYGWGIIGIGISLMKFLKPELPHLDGYNFII